MDKASVLAREVMTRAILSIEKGTPIHEAANLMAQHRVGSIFVTTNGYPVGIVTETDLTRSIALGNDARATLIEEIMSSPLFSTGPDTDLTQIANTMSVNNIKKMPVVEHGQVIGVITQTDVIKHIFSLCERLHEEYESGGISPQDFVCRSQELIGHAKRFKGPKQWHMRCEACGHQFLDEENEHGQLAILSCPKCGGKIEYDPTPPL